LSTLRSRPKRGERESYGDRQREWGRNPLDILIERESGTCKGCRLVLPSPFGGPEVACDKRMRPAARCIEDTKRCAIYTTGEPT